MTKQVLWVKKVLEAFIDEGNLNERQETIVRTRADGQSIVSLAEKLNLSVDQVNKEISQLKKIYDAAQKFSTILPPRKLNRKELFKD